jgi:hypothetical protein
MILAETTSQREKALEKLLPYQRDDFIGHLRGDEGPAGHDPPARPAAARVPAARARPAAGGPPAGHPGREGQGPRRDAAARDEPDARAPRLPPGGDLPRDPQDAGPAITEAAIECVPKRKVRAIPEIMIPLVGVKKELAMLRELCEETIRETRQARFHRRVEIKIGTMIEIPRAAVTADEIAEVADFFSFGTNDLTQLTFGYSATTGPLFCHTTCKKASTRSIPLFRSTKRAWANSCSGRSTRGARRVLVSRSGSAASTVARRLRSSFAPASASTTSAAPPSACRSLAWLQLKQRSTKLDQVDQGEKGVPSSTPHLSLLPAAKYPNILH